MSNRKRKEKILEEMERLQKELDELSEKSEEQSRKETVFDDNFMDDFDPFEDAEINTEKEAAGGYKDRETEARLRKKREEVQRQLREMKDVMRRRQKELQEMNRDIREKEREIKVKLRNYYRRHGHDNKRKNIHVDIDGVTDDLESSLSDYSRSILESVAESLRNSMNVALSSASTIGQELGTMGEEIGKEISKKFKEANVTIEKTERIPEEKLEEFYEIGSNLVSAIGDQNRLKILKELEKGAKYQKELSEITGLHGGTFKHHMDKLLEEGIEFVTQEVVRGRYLLTISGREALKLAEMLYLQYINRQEQRLRKKKGKSSHDDDDEVNIEIR